MSRGFPPKVICLAIGNVSNAATAFLLVNHAADIEAFSSHPEAGFLLLSPGAKP
jgi:predicted nuclease of predicted toxin-antitoxin system